MCSLVVSLGWLNITSIARLNVQVFTAGALSLFIPNVYNY